MQNTCHSTVYKPLTQPSHFIDTGIKPVVQEGLGIVDFYSSNQTAVIWIPEEVLVAKESSLQKKLTKFDKVFIKFFSMNIICSMSFQFLELICSWLCLTYYWV